MDHLFHADVSDASSARAAASAMDTGVANQQKLPADAVGAAPVAGSKAGGGGRKHLSSIANHVLRQCSLCVRCSSSLFRFVDFVTVFGGSCVLYKVDHIQQVHKFSIRSCRTIEADHVNYKFRALLSFPVM